MKKKMMPKNNNLSKVLLILAVVVIASVVYFNYSDSIQKAPPTSAIQRYPSCGNRICDVDVGETFNNCPSDCSANPSSTNDCPNGKPGPENTGYKVPLGQLIPYTGPMTITTPGTIIGNKIITGHLRIDADYVTVKNSEINGYIGIYPNVAGTTIDNVFMDCSGYNYCIQSPSSSDGIKIEDSTFKNAISSHIVGSSMRILRNEFSDSGEDAIKLLPGAEKDTVEGNWVFKFRFGNSMTF